MPDGGAFDGPLGVVSRVRGARRAARGRVPPRAPARRGLLRRRGGRPVRRGLRRARGCSPARSTADRAAGSDRRRRRHDGRGDGARPGTTRAGSAATRRRCAGSAPSSSCTSSRGGRWSTSAGPVGVGSGDLAARPLAAGPARAGPTTRAPPALADRDDPMLALRRGGAGRPGRGRAARRAGHRAARCACEPNGVNAIPSRGHGLAGRPRRRTPRRRAGGRRGRRRGGGRRSRRGVVDRRDRLRPGAARPARRAARTTAPRCCATGAGHDAGVLAAAGVPTAMLFVRNPTGVSHSPAEHAETRDCLAGVAALARAADLTERP